MLAGGLFCPFIFALAVTVYEYPDDEDEACNDGRCASPLCTDADTAGRCVTLKLDTRDGGVYATPGPAPTLNELCALATELGRDARLVLVLGGTGSEAGRVCVCVCVWGPGVGGMFCWL